MVTRAPDAVPRPRARAERSGSLGGGGQKSSLLEAFQAGVSFPWAYRGSREVGKDKSKATGHHKVAPSKGLTNDSQGHQVITSHCVTSGRLSEL